MVVVPSPSEAVPPSWTSDLDGRDFVVVDLETTGGSPNHDRIIEIAAVRVRSGQIRERWHSLVNPGTTVPPFITGLTGITSGLVANAPLFADVAEAFLAFVGDGIVTAHNASFDLSFLRRELARLDATFAPAATLCTLKLSRRLLPELPSHSLEAMVRALDLPARRSHRALTDALAAADLLIRLVDSAKDRGLTDWNAIARLVEGPKRRRGGEKYERSLVRELPSGPGVYLLKDQEENVLYVGKSVNVRSRVATHLRGKAEGQPRLRRHLRHVANVQTISTETEIEALLLESQLIKRYLPVGNSQQRDEVHYPFVRIDVASDYPRIELTRSPEEDDAVYIGPFRSARAVGHAVEYVRAVCGIRTCDRPALPDGRACLLLDLKKCLGPCVGAVSSDEYRSAVERAVGMLNGDWEDIIGGLEERMVKLADFQEFERAAELRDAVEHLRRIMDPQLQLADLAHFHAVVITAPGKPSPTPDSGSALASACSSSACEESATVGVQLFCIRGGRLIRQTRLDWPTDRRRLGPLVRAAYRGEEPATMTPAAAAEMTTVAGWLRQQQKRAGTVVIEVDPCQPAGALAEIRATLDRRASAGS